MDLSTLMDKNHSILSLTSNKVTTIHVTLTVTWGIHLLGYLLGPVAFQYVALV